MYAEFEAEWKAGTYPTPTYNGTHTFSMNVDENAGPRAILDAAKQRARREVARQLCMSTASVTVSEIRYAKN